LGGKSAAENRGGQHGSHIDAQPPPVWVIYSRVRSLMSGPVKRRLPAEGIYEMPEHPWRTWRVDAPRATWWPEF
jgi:hypothetical protein